MHQAQKTRGDAPTVLNHSSTISIWRSLDSDCESATRALGMEAELSTFASLSVLAFALALTAAATIGKQVWSFGVMQRGTAHVTRRLVRLGMIPRGEVGHIFAGIGL